jgi:hypothetical protein
LADFGVRQAAEVAHFDPLDEAGVHGSKRLWGIMDVEDLIIGRAELLGVPTIQSFVRGAAAPAFGLTLTYVIDDYGTHRRRGVRQEVLRIVYLNVSGALQPQEGLMNEGRGIEQGVATAPRQACSGEAAHLLVK